MEDQTLIIWYKSSCILISFEIELFIRIYQATWLLQYQKKITTIRASTVYT